MRITAEEMRGYFCRKHVDRFEALHPDGIEVTVDNLLELYRQGVDVDYALSKLHGYGQMYTQYGPDERFDERNNWSLLYGASQYDIKWRDENWELCEPVLRRTFGEALERAVEVWNTWTEKDKEE